MLKNLVLIYFYIHLNLSVNVVLASDFYIKNSKSDDCQLSDDSIQSDKTIKCNNTRFSFDKPHYSLDIEHGKNHYGVLDAKNLFVMAKFYYGKGLKNVASSYLSKSAIYGYPKAQNVLGVFYYNAKGGFKRNFRESFFWFLSSANQGNAKGYYNLGVFYYNNIAVETDFNEAYYWFTKSALLGYHPAQNFLVKINH
ncbi:MAG: tetratricopeptide repeat protein [Oligoflexales bacterium]